MRRTKHASLLFPLLLVVAGCGPHLYNEKWDPTRDGDYGARPAPAQASEDSPLDLLQKGYIRLGGLSVTVEFTEPDVDATSRFAEEAAAKGGDLVRIAVRNQKSQTTRPIPRPLYVSRSRAGWQQEMSMSPVENVEVGTIVTGHGTFYQSTTRGEVWRHDPEEAARDLRGVHLVGACDLGALEKVDALLKEGADPNFNRFGRMPLEAAADAGSEPVVRRLLEAKADPGRTTADGRKPWHAAAESGRTSLAKLLSASDPLGPAVAATADGNAASLKDFLGRRPRPTSTAWDEAALGFFAFERSREVAWPLLLEALGAGVPKIAMAPEFYRKSYLDRLLLLAEFRGRHDFMKALLKAGAEVDDVARYTFRHLGDGMAARLGHYSALTGDAEALRLLLRWDSVVSVSSGGPRDYGALHCAVFSDDLETVLCLLNEGASPNAKAADSVLLGIETTPLRLSLVQDLLRSKGRKAELSPMSRALLEAERPGVLALLQLQEQFRMDDQEFVDLQTKPVPDQRRQAWAKSWGDLARRSLEAKKTTLALELLRFSRRLRPKDPADTGLRVRLYKLSSPTPLIEAVRAEVPEDIETLLAGGASPSETDDTGWSAIQYAMESRPGFVRSTLLHPFLDHGYLPRGYAPPAPSARTNIFVKGGSLLHRAAYDGDVELTKKILKAGADLEARDREGMTPLHTAVHTGRTEVVRVLAEAGADLNARSLKSAFSWPEKTSALEFALYANSDVDSLECLKILLAKGANPNIDASDGTPLLQWARSRRSKKGSPLVTYPRYEALEAAVKKK